MTTIKPLRDRLLVERSKATNSKGGIILPDSAQKKPREGTVVAVGAGELNEQGHIEPLSVKVGDVILFGEYSGTEVNLDDKEYLIIAEKDVLGIKTST